MANQDSGFIAVSGALTSTIFVNVYQNSGLISTAGSGELVVNGQAVGNTFVSVSGTLSAKVNANVYQNSGLIQMSGGLTSEISVQNLISSYVTMYGFLSANVSILSAVRCSDLFVDYNTQVIESLGCKIGEESVDLIRYRGDTYPVSTTLSKNGNTDVTGYTFKLSTQIGQGTIYTAIGSIIDASNGIVSFPLDALAIATAGEGVYDIEGNDGTYIYTYEKGVFTLLDDLTV